MSLGFPGPLAAPWLRLNMYTCAGVAGAALSLAALLLLALAFTPHVAPAVAASRHVTHDEDDKSSDDGTASYDRAFTDNTQTTGSINCNDDHAVYDDIDIRIDDGSDADADDEMSSGNFTENTILKEGSLKERLAQAKHPEPPARDHVAVWSCVFFMFIVAMNFQTMNTLGTPILMHEFAWGKSKVTLSFFSVIIFICVCFSCIHST